MGVPGQEPECCQVRWCFKRLPFATSLRAGLAAASLGLCLAGVGVAPSAADPAGAQQGKPAMDETNNPADAAFIAAMRDLMVGMHRALPTGDTDQDFVRLMLPYQQSSMDMAKAEVQYGRDPELKAMAQTIVDDQGRRIALMKAWEDKHPK